MIKLLNALFRRRDIVNCARGVYLQRWFVVRWKERFAIFVHRFERSDEDCALHDHPWSFIVIPLWRGYVEHHEMRRTLFSVANRTRVYPLIGSRFRRAEYKHRVELIDGKPSWSLFIRFNRRRVWGFWTELGWVAWDRWWQDKCE